MSVKTDVEAAIDSFATDLLEGPTGNTPNAGGWLWKMAAPQWGDLSPELQTKIDSLKSTVSAIIDAG